MKKRLCIGVTHRMMEENKALPDLIVIDGDKGQLSAAMESIYNLKLENEVQVISIAKRLEEIYYPNDRIRYILAKI